MKTPARISDEEGFWRHCEIAALLSSLAQTAFMQRLNAMMKTTVRITLAKLAKVKGQLYQNHR
jgi:hypothetical protein